MHHVTMLIVLINAYKGVVVSELTSPPPASQTFRVFSDLTNFTLISTRPAIVQSYFKVNMFEPCHRNSSSHGTSYLIDLDKDLSPIKCRIRENNCPEEIMDCRNYISAITRY